MEKRDIKCRYCGKKFESPTREDQRVVCPFCTHDFYFIKGVTIDTDQYSLYQSNPTKFHNVRRFSFSSLVVTAVVSVLVSSIITMSVGVFVIHCVNKDITKQINESKNFVVDTSQYDDKINRIYADIESIKKDLRIEFMNGINSLRKSDFANEITNKISSDANNSIEKKFDGLEENLRSDFRNFIVDITNSMRSPKVPDEIGKYFILDQEEVKKEEAQIVEAMTKYKSLILENPISEGLIAQESLIGKWQLGADQKNIMVLCENNVVECNKENFKGLYPFKWEVKNNSILLYWHNERDTSLASVDNIKLTVGPHGVTVGSKYISYGSNGDMVSSKPNKKFNKSISKLAE